MRYKHTKGDNVLKITLTKPNFYFWLFEGMVPAIRAIWMAWTWTPKTPPPTPMGSSGRPTEDTFIVYALSRWPSGPRTSVSLLMNRSGRSFELYFIMWAISYWVRFHIENSKIWMNIPNFLFWQAFSYPNQREKKVFLSFFSRSFSFFSRSFSGPEDPA